MRKELGEEMAARGAVRGSGGFFSGLVDVSGAAGLQGKVAAAATARMEVLEVGGAGKKKRNPTPLFIAASR